MPACFSTGGITSVNGGRLSFVSGDPTPSSNVTGATDVYWTHYLSDQISLYDGSWQTISSSEQSLSLSSLSADTNYDIFGYLNAGALSLESVVWTNATARATALARQDGVLTKSGDATRRYIGTLRIGATAGESEDSLTKRFLWNYQNRIWRAFSRKETASDSTYSGGWRQANANSANQVEFVRGLDEDIVDVVIQCAALANSIPFTHGAPGIGIDSTSTDAAVSVHAGGGSSGMLYGCSGRYLGLPGVGYHTLVWLEAGVVNNTNASTRFFYSGYTPSGVHPVTVEPGVSGGCWG